MKEDKKNLEKYELVRCLRKINKEVSMFSAASPTTTKVCFLFDDVIKIYCRTFQKLRHNQQNLRHNFKVI